MLSAFQERVARMVAALPEARGFALGGGGALVVHGLTERSTNDLDFFTTAPTAVPVLRHALEIAFRRGRPHRYHRQGHRDIRTTGGR